MMQALRVCARLSINRTQRASNLLPTVKSFSPLKPFQPFRHLVMSSARDVPSLAPPPAALLPAEGLPGYVITQSFTVPENSKTLTIAEALNTYFPALYPTTSSAKKAVRRKIVRVNGTLSYNGSSNPGPGDIIQILDRLLEAPSTAEADPEDPPAEEGKGSEGVHVPRKGARGGAAKSDKPRPGERGAMGPWGGPLPWIAYQDEHMAVVVKPQGMPTQKGTQRNSERKKRPDDPPALQSLLTTILRLSTLVGGLRKPLPVHRLDLATGGLVIIAKTRDSLNILSGVIASRKVSKRYLALLDGRLGAVGDVGTVDVPLRGRRSVTGFRVVSVEGSEEEGWLSTVELLAKTGRKHQLRKHMSLCGCPIIGDPRYGSTSEDRRHLMESKGLATHSSGAGSASPSVDGGRRRAAAESESEDGDGGGADSDDLDLIEGDEVEDWAGADASLGPGSEGLAAAGAGLAPQGILITEAELRSRNEAGPPGPYIEARIVAAAREKGGSVLLTNEGDVQLCLWAVGLGLPHPKNFVVAAPSTTALGAIAGKEPSEVGARQGDAPGVPPPPIVGPASAVAPGPVASASAGGHGSGPGPGERVEVGIDEPELYGMVRGLWREMRRHG